MNAREKATVEGKPASNPPSLAPYLMVAKVIMLTQVPPMRNETRSRRRSRSKKLRVGRS
jgi:hypothetical protein